MPFDPASIALSAKSGLNPPDWVVLLPDRAHARQQRFALAIGRPGVVVYAVIWLILLPTSGLIAQLIANPFLAAALYLLGFTTALGGLFGVFLGHPPEPHSSKPACAYPDPWRACLSGLDHRRGG
jgi:hypothetical protein